LKQHKPWFREECSQLLHERKLAKLCWLQYLSQINRGNLNNVRCETHRTFRKRGSIWKTTWASNRL